MAAPPPAPPAPSIHECISEMDDGFLALRRAAAAFLSLTGSYNTYKGTLPPGERPKGLPIFEMKAPLFGAQKTEMVPCVFDLKDMDPSLYDHVLVPFINTSARGLKAAVDRIDAAVKAIRPQLAAITGANPASPAEAG